VGVLVPATGAIAHRIGPQRLLPGLILVELAGVGMTAVDRLAVIVAGLALMAFAMFSTVTVCQLLIPRLVDRDRGSATSLHLTIYYLGGGLGAYLPGLLLNDGWGRLVSVCAGAVAVGLIASTVLTMRLSRRDVTHPIAPSL
jgi:MFS transporter, YNFM family, putative membrane transport protein